MEKILNTLFPPKCIYCGKYYGDICKNCLLKIKVARNYYCIVCDRPSFNGNTHIECKGANVPISIFSAFEYKDMVRDCIRRSKYSLRMFAPLKSLANEAVYTASKCGVDYEGYSVVPIPLSKKKEKERGFNQASLIGASVAKEFSIKLEEKILIRKKDTKSQYKKSRKERFENIKDAFLVKKDLTDLNVLVVDDICTTGATLLEASQILYEANAKNVKCFTLSKEF